MSRSELTDAYVSGRISRRSFVRGMVALGASVPVAMALADKVSAAPGGAARISRSSDVYPDPYPWPPKTGLPGSSGEAGSGPGRSHHASGDWCSAAGSVEHRGPAGRRCRRSRSDCPAHATAQEVRGRGLRLRGYPETEPLAGNRQRFCFARATPSGTRSRVSMACRMFPGTSH